MRAAEWVGLFVVNLHALAGCTSPADRFDAAAAAAGLYRTEVEGAGFRHAVYVNRVLATDSFTVYIDGDGMPYLGKAIARDPTPRQSLALALLAEDAGPALYLGRPCYHGEAGSAGCTHDLWTRARYGEAVVASMAAAVRHLIAAQSVRSVTFVGHSGGGSLAMLVAPRISETQAVVTIAADLDVAAWARHTRQDLSGSLDPAAAAPLSAGIRQYHYAGSRDQIVPPSITAAGLHGETATLTVIDGFDHVCCWATAWPRILARLDAAGDENRPLPAEPLRSGGYNRIRAPMTPP